MSRPRIQGLEPKAARVLLALRAGPCDTAQLTERFAAGVEFARILARRGYVESELLDGQTALYSITPAGRQACPSRRELDAFRPRSSRGTQQ